MKISKNIIRKWFIIKNREVINGKLLILLICLFPITQLINYLVSTTEQLNYHAYPSLLIFFIFFFLRPFNKISVLLVIFFLVYSFLFSVDSFSGRASYMIAFSLTCITFSILPNLRIGNIKLEKV